MFVRRDAAGTFRSRRNHWSVNLKGSADRPFFPSVSQKVRINNEVKIIIIKGRELSFVVISLGSR